MDLDLQRPGGTCALTGRPFAPGDAMCSALVRGAAGIERRDVHADAWTGPPAGALAWWRSMVPAARSSGPVLAPTDVLLDVLEELDGRPDDAALRYLLALELVRRRALRIVDGPAAAPNELVLACRKRDREFRVAVADVAEAADEGVARRLTALLWSGEAA
jgi:hypothetical protein